MITAVFDCMGFLQAATNDRGPASACLAFVEDRVLTLYLSPAILSEVQEVLARPTIRKRFPHLTQERGDIFIQKLGDLAVLVSDVPDAGVALSDPDDLPYLNLLIAANADYLVTRDNGLLDLMKDPSFLAKYPHVQIVEPVSFLSSVRARQTP